MPTWTATTPPSCAPSSRWDAASAWTWSPRAWRPRASCSSCVRRAATSHRDACSATRARPKTWAPCCRARPAPAARRSRASRTKPASFAMAAPEARQKTSPSVTRFRPRRRWRRGLLVLCVLIAGVGEWHVLKPLPAGVAVRGAPVATPDDAVQFLADIAAQDGAGGMVREQAIHAATLELVRGARDFLVLDYFLFNAQGGPAGTLHYEKG